MPDIRFTEAPGALPAGRRIYAVGDVHGCASRLAELHAMIAADLRRRPVSAPLLLHIGDYVDKGEESAGVLDLLTSGRAPVPGAEVVNLIGNHERMMLQVLEGDPAARADWLWCGGRPTLASYGLDPEAPSAAWAEAVPATHRAFLARGLALHHREGDYLFVHAGIRPGVPLEAQSEEDLLGIRHRFLQCEEDFGFVVVHGHTAREAPEVRDNRVGLDTAAWSGGPLTCAVLEGRRIGFLFA